MIGWCFAFGFAALWIYECIQHARTIRREREQAADVVRMRRPTR